MYCRHIIDDQYGKSYIPEGMAYTGGVSCETSSVSSSSTFSDSWSMASELAESKNFGFERSADVELALPGEVACSCKFF